VRAIKIIIGSVLALGLLVGSSLGVAAQEEAAAPVEFTATWSWGPDVRAETYEAGDGVVMTRGGAWRPGVLVEASDPRLQGSLSIAANSDQYLGGPEVWHYAFRIQNEEGAWQQLPTINVALGEDDLHTTTGVLVGEGAYDGLIAVFDNRSEGTVWDLHGYIIDGELTPAPEPYTGE
jgi:hypothetical protein